MSTPRYDAAHVQEGLKDFQRATVEHVFHRLYLDPEPTRRFLVADEVGLGKTLVARGVIAKTIEHLQDKVDRIDIVYICSNADIARQNIERLNVTEQGDFALASRITLLPLALHELTGRPVNFVSFTPGTSFAMGQSMGMATERVLLYEMLRQAWGRDVLKGTPALRILQGSVRRLDRFQERVKRFRRSERIEPTLQAAFISALAQERATAAAAGRRSLEERFTDLADDLRWKRQIPAGEARERRKLVSDLRTVLARTCVNALEPDLIILDEFQRFRYLLDGEDDAAELARTMFEYEEARVLLLSATPYKMYTQSHELDDDHYADFIRTLEFLMGADEAARCAADLRTFMRELLQLDGGDPSPVLARKEFVERRLRRVITRTERLASTPDRDGMLVEHPMETPLEPRDLRAFCAYDAAFRLLDAGGSLEYWKSAPYLLNFMEDYQVGRKLSAVQPRERAEVAPVLDSQRDLLPTSDLLRYHAIDPGNARLRGLIADTVGRGAWKLLWLPPSLPYYEPGPPFDAPEVAGMTKRLVFSSWKLVPRVIAALVSYDAERHMVTADGTAAYENSAEGRKRPQLLRFRRTGDRLSGLALFGLVYPSSLLSRIADPLVLMAGPSRHGEAAPRASVLERARAGIERALAPIVEKRPTDGAVDERWYWAAPLLLDRHDGSATTEWLRQAGPLSWISSDARDGDAGDDAVESSLLASVLEEAGQLLDDDRQLRRVPDDLSDVLARIALAGPAVVARRAVARATGPGQPAREDALCDASARVAWSLRNLFNLPEVMAMVRSLPLDHRGHEEGDDAYWRRILEYCLNGNLQAVVDEYAHVLPEWNGQLSKPADEVAGGIASAMHRALSIRTASYRPDDVRIDGGELQVERGKLRFRGRFALRFGQDQTEEGTAAVRADQLRTAFNSPFWPFVLATTSIGQEGLDFHLYCHAVVHWNLPTNPVDLEQREGRVHRYKGHAVRKNLAAACRGTLTHGSADPWVELFEEGCRRRTTGVTEIVPYWVFSQGDDARIERHLPKLPMSREDMRLTELRSSLAAYRLAFGQPRQEDLVAYLTHLSSDHMPWLDQLQIDLRPPSSGTDSWKDWRDRAQKA